MELGAKRGERAGPPPKEYLLVTDIVEPVGGFTNEEVAAGEDSGDRA